MKRARNTIRVPVHALSRATQNVKSHVREEKSNIKRAFVQNFSYGFTGVMIPVSVFIGNIFIILFSLYIFYSVLSMVVNREKYVTNLGKYFYFPFPAMLGGTSAYYLGELIKNLIP